MEEIEFNDDQLIYAALFKHNLDKAYESFNKSLKKKQEDEEEIIDVEVIPCMLTMKM